MTKAEAIVKAMKILNEDVLLMPGSWEHRIVTRTISSQIDSLGPEKALEQVQQTKAHLIAQIEQMTM